MTNTESKQLRGKLEEILSRNGLFQRYNDTEEGSFSEAEKVLSIVETLQSHESQIKQDIFKKVEYKINMILLGIQVFKASEKERGVEESRGLIRKDGGATLSAFSFIDRLGEELKTSLKALEEKEIG